MVEAQTIRVQITQADAPFAEVDVEVYPWHTASFGDDPWEAWLHHVAPEWVDRTASGVRQETFRAVATDTADGAQLADIRFTHTAPKAITVTVENEAAAQVDALVSHLAVQDPARLERERAEAWGADRTDRT